MSLFTELLALVGVVRPARIGSFARLYDMASYRKQWRRLQKLDGFCTEEPPYQDRVRMHCDTPTTMCAVAVANAEYWDNLDIEIWWEEDMSPEWGGFDVCPKCGGFNVCPGCVKCPGCIRCRWYAGGGAHNRVHYTHHRRARYVPLRGSYGNPQRGASATVEERMEAHVRFRARDTRCANPVLGARSPYMHRGFPADIIVDVHAPGLGRPFLVMRSEPNTLHHDGHHFALSASDGNEDAIVEL